jgi:hypothetical protein
LPTSSGGAFMSGCAHALPPMIAAVRDTERQKNRAGTFLGTIRVCHV